MSTFEETLSALDDALAVRGFTRARRFVGLRWHGESHHRACVVTVMPLSRTRYAGEVRLRRRIGYKLTLEIAVDVRVHLYFVRASFAANRLVALIYRLRNLTVLDTPQVVPGFSIVTNDITWASMFTERADAMQETATLINERASSTFAGSVYLAPRTDRGTACHGSPVLQLADLTAARVTQAVESLAVIARAADSLPAPASMVRLGRLQRLAERHPFLAVAGLFVAALTVLGLGGLLAILLVVALMA